MLKYYRMLLLSIAVFPVLTHAQRFVYRKVDDKDTAIIVVTFKKNNDGYVYSSETVLPAGKIIEDATLTENGLALTYSYKNEGEQFRVQCSLENEVIRLLSNRKGKEQRKTLKPKRIWRQVFPYDLSSFVLSSDDTIQFESVALAGPAALSIGGMQAVKLKGETVMVNGSMQTSLHVRVALAGIFARFWHADYWFRTSDGRFLKGIWVDKPGAKPSVVELLEEKQ